MNGIHGFLLVLIIITIITNSYQILNVFFKKTINKITTIKEIITN